MFTHDDRYAIHRHYWTEILVCILTTFAWQASVVGQEQTVETVVKSLSKKIELGDYSAATDVLREANARALASQIKKGDDFKYLAVAGYVTVVAGIPHWRARSSLSTGRFTTLPGTSDYSRTKAEEEYQDAASDFAATFNTYARYFGTEVATEQGELELSTVRDGLSLTDAEWERIPLHARLTIRSMAEKMVEHEDNKSKASNAKKKTAK